MPSLLALRYEWDCQPRALGLGNPQIPNKVDGQIGVVQGRFADQSPELNLARYGAPLGVCMRFGFFVQVAVNAYGRFHCYLLETRNPARTQCGHA